MPRARVMPSALLAWIEAQAPGTIMRRETFGRIEDRAFDKLRAAGVPEDRARTRARAQAGSAYWRAAVKKYLLATSTPDKAPTRSKKRTRKNPVLAIMGNPAPRMRVFSGNVHSIAYTHRGDGKDYRHDFAGGVHMAALADGTVLIYHPQGLPVWREFK